MVRKLFFFPWTMVISLIWLWKLMRFNLCWPMNGKFGCAWKEGLAPIPKLPWGSLGSYACIHGWMYTDVYGCIRMYTVSDWWLTNLPLWKIWKSVGMFTFPIYTNQWWLACDFDRSYQNKTGTLDVYCTWWNKGPNNKRARSQKLGGAWSRCFTLSLFRHVEGM